MATSGASTVASTGPSNVASTATLACRLLAEPRRGAVRNCEEETERSDIRSVGGLPVDGGSYRRVGPTQAVSVLSISCRIRSCSVVYSIGSISAMIVVYSMALPAPAHTHSLTRSG